MRKFRLGRLTLVSVEPAELFAMSGSGLRHIVTVNSEIFVLAHEDPAYAAVLKRAVNTVDSRVLQWAASLVDPGFHHIKLSGSDLLEPLAKHCRDKKSKLFLLGATGEANELACRNLLRRYPGVLVKGYAPPFTEDIQDEVWNAAIFAELNRFQPEYLVVAFRPPKAEYWIDRARNQLETLGVRFVAGFGGAVNFAAGLVPRAPVWVQKAGLEWLFRLIVEPKRFGRTVRMMRMPYYVFTRWGNE